MSLFRIFFIFFFLFQSLSLLTFSQSAIVRFTGEGSTKVGYDAIRFLAAADSVLDITEARRFFQKGAFTPNTLPDLNLGIAKDNYWVQFTIQNSTPASRTLYVNLENPRLNEVDVFVVTNDSVTSTFILGDNFSFGQRELSYNQFAFPVVLKSGQLADVFLYVKHKGNTLQMPVRVSDENTFLSYIEGNYLATGIVSGILLITFFFGIFFLINTRDLLFFYYSGYTLSSALWIWSTEGFGFQYLWPDTPELATRVGPGMSVITLCFFLATCLQFCKPYDSTSSLRKLLSVILIFFFLWGILPFMPFIPITRANFMSSFLSVHFLLNLLCIFLLILYLTRLALKGNYIVLYYFLAVAINLIFSFIIIARHSGALNIPISSGLFMSIGFVVEIILMTAGITKQFYGYKKEKEETLIAYLEQQKSITNKILQTQETERNRISRELHDDIGPKLTQITLMSEAVKNQLKPETVSFRELTEIAGTSRNLVSRMGEIIWSLNPENKSLHNLLGYLREQLNQLLEYSTMEYAIHFNVLGEDRELSHSQLRNILLATKEIVNNAVKHSAAKNIKISCLQKTDCIDFHIEDDGKGFDLYKPVHSSGIRNIRFRIEEVGGTIQIETGPGKGTSYNYSIPF